MTYKTKTTDIEVIHGVSVDITVRGDEDKAEKVAMDLRDRLGQIAEAYETETPPRELTSRSDKNTPLMTVAWDRVFEPEVSDE